MLRVVPDGLVFDDLAGAERLKAATERVGEIITSRGGEISHINRAGIFCLWAGASETPDPALVHAAGETALEVRQTVEGFESARMSIGAGSMWLPVMGGASGRWFAPVGGHVLDELDQASVAARAGDIVLGPASAEVAGDRIVGSNAATGTIRVDLTSELNLTVSLNSDRPPAEPLAPGLVARRADAGITNEISEISQATALMAELSLVQIEDGDRLEVAQRVVRSAQDVVARYDGALTDVSLHPSGLRMTAVWGIGGHTHEDDHLRAVRAGLDLLRESHHADLSIGIASGPTFVGALTCDPDGCRRLATLGPAVRSANELCRLEMGRQVHCDQVTMHRTSSAVVYSEQAVRRAAKIDRVFRPVAFLEQLDQVDSTILGRGRERHLLGDRLSDLVDGRSAVVFVEGEAGIGKSALLREVARRAESLPIRRLVLQASALDQSTPYYPWRAVFGRLIGRDGHEVDKELRARLDEDQRPVASLLSVVLPVSSEPPAEVLDMSDEVRAEATRLLVGHLMGSLVGDDAVLLEVEDAHWLDSASLALVEHLTRVLPQLLVVVTARPVPEDDSESPLARLRARTDLDIELGPLSDEDVTALVCRRLAVPAVPESIASAILARTEGHPLFVEELAAAMRDSGALRIVGDERQVIAADIERAVQHLPATIAAAVGSRLDRLPIRTRRVLEVASVIGRAFTVDGLAAIHPDGGGARSIRTHLDPAVALGMVVAEGDELRFAHSLIQQAAYETLSLDERRRIHGLLAAWLSRRAVEGGVAPAELAHHCLEAGQREPAVAALTMAARAAIDSASHTEVVSLLSTAVEIGGDLVDATELATWHLEIGTAEVRLGRLAAARTSLLRSLDTVGMPHPRSRWRLLIGLIWQLVRQAAHRLLPRLPQGRHSAEIGRIDAAARAYFELTAARYAAQDALGLAYAGVRSVNEAERNRPTRVLARGYSFMDFGAGVTGRRRLSSRYHERAVAAAEAVRSIGTQAEVHLNRGVLGATVGDWDLCDTHLGLAAGLYDHAQDRRGAARALAVEAFTLGHRGQCDRAYEKYEHLRHAAEQVDDGLIEVWAQVGLARAGLRRGDLDAVTLLLTDAAPQFEEVAEVPSSIARLGFLALAAWQDGAVDAAVRHARAGLSLMPQATAFAPPHTFDGFAGVTRVLVEAAAYAPDDVALAADARLAVKVLTELAKGLPLARSRALVYRGELAVRAGRTGRGRRWLAKGLEAAEEMAMPFEEAMALVAMGRTMDPNDPERSACLSRAEAILDRLGNSHEARLVAQIRR